MAENLDQTDGIGGRHEAARLMAERAVAAQAAGDGELADRLFADAARIDPDAVSAVLAERVADPAEGSTGADAMPQDDDEIAEISSMRGVASKAPSRSGITGSGSGADGEGV